MMFSVLLCSGDREVELAAVEGAAYNHKLCLTIVFDKIYNLKSIFFGFFVSPPASERFWRPPAFGERAPGLPSFSGVAGGLEGKRSLSSL